jgi:hypothetical protein
MTRKSSIPYNFLATTIDYTTFFINMDNILAPNQLDDISTRIQHAKEFLRENPNELPITAMHIYNLLPSTLYSSLKRPKNCKHGGQNKILQQHHIEALHLFIRLQLAYSIQLTC